VFIQAKKAKKKGGLRTRRGKGVLGGPEKNEPLGCLIYAMWLWHCNVNSRSGKGEIENNGERSTEKSGKNWTENTRHGGLIVETKLYDEGETGKKEREKKKHITGGGLWQTVQEVGRKEGKMEKRVPKHVAKKAQGKPAGIKKSESPKKTETYRGWHGGGIGRTSETNVNENGHGSGKKEEGLSWSGDSGLAGREKRKRRGR